MSWSSARVPPACRPAAARGARATATIPEARRPLLHATFSIVALDRAAGQLGIAIASKLPCVGSFCPVVRPGLGAVVTQAWTNPTLPDRVLDRLAAGDDAEQALATVIAAEVDAPLRQVGVVDAAGRAAGFTGAGVEPVSGQRIAPDRVVLGNMLPDPSVLEAMDQRFAAAAGSTLAERLLLALEPAPNAAGTHAAPARPPSRWWRARSSRWSTCAPTTTTILSPSCAAC